MQTSQLFNESDAQLLAYGKEVSELLSSESPEEWTTDLWSIFGGFMIAQRELGHSPEISDMFFSFRDLLFFFEKINKIRSGDQ
jgi:hypothetical protein